MAFEDTNLTRLKILLKSPKKEIGKVLPFLRSRINPYQRAVLESVHIFSNSKPYSNHNDLLKTINFKNGFFVQCGGNDGYGNDPTYYLEKVLGWSGIIVEPLPIYKLCKKNRSKSIVYNCAVGSFKLIKDETTTFIDCNAMSFVEGSIDNQDEWIAAGERTQNIKAKKVTVPIKPVQELIDEYKIHYEFSGIDLFVADTEGYEFQLLQGLDYTKNSPTYILLEIHEDSELEKITKYLNEKGYELFESLKQRDFLFKLINT